MLVNAGLVNRAAKQCLVNCQQIRFAMKTFRFRTSYGEPPLFRDDQYEEAKEAGRLDELQYKQIRFAQLFEYNSPLYDDDYESFVKLVMQGGRKGTAEDLMIRTFYEIKSIQFPKLRKSRERLAASKSDSEAVNSLQDLEANEHKEIVTNPMEIFKGALLNSEPVVITKKVKRGGATYQVPFPIRKPQGEWFAKKWLIAAVRERPKPRKLKRFPDTMAQELVDAYYNRGKVVKKKDDIHRLADANKAYAHYRWG